MEFGETTIHAGDDIRGRNPVCDFFHDYWLSLKAAKPKPSRADVSPAALTRYLDRVVLMDVTRAGDDFSLVVRLIGTFVTGHYGEISGKDIKDMENKAAAGRVYHLSGMMLRAGAPLMSLTPAFAPDRRHKEGIALYLPLYDENGEINMIMVAVDVQPLSRPAMPPR